MGQLLLDKMIFKVLPIGVSVYAKNDLSIKKGQGQPKITFFRTLLHPCPQCCIPGSRAIGPLVPEKRIFKGFCHIHVCRGGGASLSCDPDAVNKLSFPLPIEAPYEIWL